MGCNSSDTFHSAKPNALSIRGSCLITYRFEWRVDPKLSDAETFSEEFGIADTRFKLCMGIKNGGVWWTNLTPLSTYLEGAHVRIEYEVCGVSRPVASAVLRAAECTRDGESLKWRGKAKVWTETTIPDLTTKVLVVRMVVSAGQEKFEPAVDSLVIRRVLKRTDEFSDILVSCNNGTVKFPAHRMMLSIHSPVLQIKLRNWSAHKSLPGSSDIDLNDEDAKTVDVLLNWIYTRSFVCTLVYNQKESEVKEVKEVEAKETKESKEERSVSLDVLTMIQVFRLAHLLQIEELLGDVTEWLCANIQADNVLNILALATMHATSSPVHSSTLLKAAGECMKLNADAITRANPVLS